MLCPVDKAELKIAERQGVEIDYCPTCRGVWLDRGELDKIIERGAAMESRAGQARAPHAGQAPHTGQAPYPAAPYPERRGHDDDDDDDDDDRRRYAPGGHDGSYGGSYGQRRKKRESWLGAIPVSLGPEDADGCHGDGRQRRGEAGGGRALAWEVAHLALDGPGVVARAAGREPLGSDLGQHAGAKRGRRSGGVRWARGMARRRTRRAPVKLRRSGSMPSRSAA